MDTYQPSTSFHSHSYSHSSVVHVLSGQLREHQEEAFTDTERTCSAQKNHPRTFLTLDHLKQIATFWIFRLKIDNYHKLINDSDLNFSSIENQWLSSSSANGLAFLHERSKVKGGLFTISTFVNSRCFEFWAKFAQFPTKGKQKYTENEACNVTIWYLLLDLMRIIHIFVTFPCFCHNITHGRPRCFHPILQLFSLWSKVNNLNTKLKSNF